MDEIRRCFGDGTVEERIQNLAKLEKLSYDKQAQAKAYAMEQLKTLITDVYQPFIIVDKAKKTLSNLQGSEKEITISLPGGVEMEFARILSGEFLMGSDDGYSDEKPIHKVYLDEYWIGKYPVTNEQYRVYVKDSGVKKPKYQNKYNDPKKHHHPVVRVSWEDATTFCKWLSAYSGKKIVLPTEAQWEKAARGADGRRYPWGNQAPTKKLCKFDETFGDMTEVGSYPSGVSPYGALDMAGNVWEWCADWYGKDYYKSSSPQNPIGPNKGKVRVLRGGSWYSNEYSVRSANRVRLNPNLSRNFLGFRCSLEA